VTETAREAGFAFPAALTAAAWSDCVAWTDAAERACQDESGRLWDVLSMASWAIRANNVPSDSLKFSLYRIPRGGTRPRLVTLLVQIGPGDAGEPVVTIMLPDED